jgi:type II secretory pathway component PulJ
MARESFFTRVLKARSRGAELERREQAVDEDKTRAALRAGDMNPLLDELREHRKELRGIRSQIVSVFVLIVTLAVLGMIGGCVAVMRG